jgi:PAS domain-containing protein
LVKSKFRLNRWIWSPGIYNVPRMLSLSVLLIAFFSLSLNYAFPPAFRETIPWLFRIPAAVSLAMLLLAFSVRLTRWERLDLRSLRRAKLSRICAGGSALLSLLDTVLRGHSDLAATTPVLVAISTCILAAVIILQARSRGLLARRALILVALLTSTWLLLANVYAVNGRISYELTADPASALLLFLMTMSLIFAESGNGLIPVTVSSVLGERASLRLLVSAILVPIFLGYLRLQTEGPLGLPPNLMIALHVFGTLAIMGLLLVYSLKTAKIRFDEQRSLQIELERGERTFAALLEQGSEVYLTMNIAGRLLSCNESARRHLGLPDVARTVVSIEDLILPESKDKVRGLPEVLLRSISSNTVLLFRLSNGESMPLYITAACRMRHGAPEEILLVGRPLPLGLRSPSFSQAFIGAA